MTAETIAARLSNATGGCARCENRDATVVGGVELEGLGVDGRAYDEEGWYLCADCYAEVGAFLCRSHSPALSIGKRCMHHEDCKVRLGLAEWCGTCGAV